MKERYGTNLNGIEWEIDLERKLLISTEDPKTQKKLNQKEITRLRRLIKDKNNGRKDEMRNL